MNRILKFFSKLVIKNCLKRKSILLNGKNTISRHITNTKPSKEFPIKIKNSTVSNIKISEGCYIDGCRCIGDKIILGRFVYLNGPGTTISALVNKVEIGSFSSIAEGVKIYEWNHKIDRLSTHFFNVNVFKEDILLDINSNGDVIIEEDVWIGSNSVVLSGVTIGRGSIIGAGSVVTKDIPKYSIAFGNPAKIYRKRFDNKTISYLENLKWWEWEIDKIKKNKKLLNSNIVEFLNDIEE